MQACNFPEKRTRWQVFSCESCETLKNIFFVEHLRATASEQTWNFMWCYSWLSETGHPTQWHIQTYWLSCICTIVTWNTFIRRTYVFLINYTLKDPTNIYVLVFFRTPCEVFWSVMNKSTVRSSRSQLLYRLAISKKFTYFL